MLTRAVESYLEVRRAGGFELRVSEYILRDFARFATKEGDERVRSATAITWAARAPSVPQRDKRLREVIRFARHMRAEDAAHEIPPERVFCAPRTRRRPHIYTPEQVEQILAEAGRLRPTGSLRPLTHQTLYGLLASCGLRISEALALRLEDVTPEGLVIRKTKFRKSRLVPMHESTSRAVEIYAHRRLRMVTTTDHLFVSLRGRPLIYQCVDATFISILRGLGLRGRPGEPGPRLHDLRHTVAVRALEGCSPGDVASHVHALSTYLGHARISDTYWYLHVTPQLMTGVADACRSYLEGGRP